MQLNCEMGNSSVYTFSRKQRRLSITSLVNIRNSCFPFCPLRGRPLTRWTRQPSAHRPGPWSSFLNLSISTMSLAASLTFTVSSPPSSPSLRPWSCFLWRQCVPTLSFQYRGQLAPETYQLPIRDRASSCHSHCGI